MRFGGAVLIFLAGCRAATLGDDQGTVPPAPSASTETESASGALPAPPRGRVALHPHSPARAGEQIDVPAGRYRTGSLPGEDGRDPTTEPYATDIALEPFGIDALPYPNDPSSPPRTGVSREEAARLCAEGGERLCTEVEWEAACKGPSGEAYATGAAWDDACDHDGGSCVSSLGARAMGVLREWTSSDLAPTAEHKVVAASVRGADKLAGAKCAGATCTGADKLAGAKCAGATCTGAGSMVTADDRSPVPQTAHRCAHRARASEYLRPDGPTGPKCAGALCAAASDLGFRCCKGPANTAVMPAPKAYPAFQETKLTAVDVARIFAGIPELERIARGVHLAGEGEFAAVLSRSKAARGAITFAASPLLWSPETGAELLVLAGHSLSTSWVVALYPLADGTYKLASYFFMLGDPVAVALTYDPWRRQDLFWTSCWGCVGEEGSVRVRDDHRVVIVQH